MQKLLVIGFVWPEPNSSAAGIRMVQLIQLFQKQHFEVVFASPAAISEFRIAPEVLGIRYESIVLNHASFDAFLLQENPAVVLFDRFLMEEQFGWRVKELLPDALRILDTEDLHFLREARKIAWKENRSTQLADFHSEKTLRELASIFRCDASLIISEAEMEMLIQMMGIDKRILFYFPMLPVATLVQTELPAFELRKDFVFIGNFLHEPNFAAVQELKEKIWPLIYKKIPHAELHIYGAYATQKVFNLHQPKERFLVKGRAENAQETVKQYRVGLAPLRFGAGLKGKLLEAMMCGTPTVTTSIGCEGIGTDENWSGFIAESLEEFAQAALTLYEQEPVWKEKQAKGFALLNSSFHAAKHEERFITWFTWLLQNKQQNRLHNFMGAILHHEQMQATKYMSKWIEEKNKS